jgi:hypothetical protein
MWIEKLAEGVLQVDTPLGKRYIRPDFKQRLRLLWIFRNFQSLPQQVLSVSEQRFLNELCSEHRFVAVSASGGHNQVVIGRVEKRLPVQPEALSAQKSGTGAASPLADQGGEVASA